MSFAGAMVIAMILDALVGWPGWLFARLGHPVTWLGRLISALDARLNRPALPAVHRRLWGLATALLTITVAAALGLGAQALLPAGWGGTVLAGVLAWPLLALRSMHAHVAAVARPLLADDLPGARRAVAMIVGRNPARLDAAGVARAATESLAENTSDGIIAPLFWGLLAGLPGIAAYKAINTLDSMIGHRTARHAAFGWASARIDDAANWVPARLTGLILALASPAPRAALRCMGADARHHRSPNGGWPEAAMAGALAVRLSGPRVYDERVAREPWVNRNAPDPTPGDLTRALALYRRAMSGVGVAITLLWLGTRW